MGGDHRWNEPGAGGYGTSNVGPPWGAAPPPPAPVPPAPRSFPQAQMAPASSYANQRAWAVQAQLEADRQRQQAAADARHRRRRARRVRRLLSSVAALGSIALISVVMTNLQEDAKRPRRSLIWGLDGDAIDAGDNAQLDIGNRPTPRRAASKKPLGTPAPPGPESPNSGAYAFLALQGNTAKPVAYDPCRPIKVVINDRTAPTGAPELISESLRTISNLSGLKFIVEGETDETPRAQRAPYQPDRYGDRWAPVLIAWTDPTELVGLSGDIVGLGGSVPVEVGDDGDRAYVSGQVALDGPDLRALLDRPNGYLYAKAVIMHELGHLIGLAHADDPTQLMHQRGQHGVYGPQPGDAAGLALEGQGRCFPKL